jgi:hypothetical protein
MAEEGCCCDTLSAFRFGNSIFSHQTKNRLLRPGSSRSRELVGERNDHVAMAEREHHAHDNLVTAVVRFFSSKASAQ